jgi:ubiquitin-like modifier-activating enzyme ATG7
MLWWALTSVAVLFALYLRLNRRDTADPTRLAETSVNLNVNLMRWRALPELDVDMLSTSKFLLIGAGA